MKRNLFALLLIAGLLFAACAGPPDANDVIPDDVVDPTTEQEEEADVEEEPMEEDETEAGDEGMVPAEVSELTIPFRDLWAESPHNAAEDASFTHWNEDDPAEIPQSCAACHSTPGHLDYLGADGTAANSVEEAVAIGTTITCEACHNEVTWDMDTVLFPSGVELTDLGSEANCMTCHQGRSSTNTVVDAIEEVGLTDDPDTPSEDLGFVNIHYYAAAATMYGSEVHGGFEYEGNRYVGKFEHVADFDTCTSCHNAHTLEVDPEPCAACHDGVSTVEDLNNIRTAGSLIDYDGDGSIDESISGEIEGLQEMLFQAIQTYADEVIGTPIVYSSESYPYFFIDSNADGELQDDEASFPNQYNAYSPRLLKAAYNYQVSQKDPGAFAHGAKYVIQLLYDSTADLNEAIGDPVDLSAANRNDPGHFSATEQAFRHWDEDGIVPANCSRCHAAGGLEVFLQDGVTISLPPSDSLTCTSCHVELEEFTLYEVGPVPFPSGAVVGFSEDQAENNTCLNCHQGRESSISVQAAIDAAGVTDDEVSEALRFRNPHYFASGATLFGTEVQGGYEYANLEYAGQFGHVESFDTCSECHDVHALTVNEASCATCHGEGPLTAIRLPEGDEPIDYDGDGDVEEGIAGEIETLEDLLLQSIYDYTATTIGTPVVYDGARYPYFFIDLNADGVADPDEANFGNQYATWTPRLLRAAYNYKYAGADPGGYAHNPDYILQLLYDSLNDLGVDVSSFVRP